MKQTIYTLLAMLAASVSMPAAADDYLPLVREGVRWHYVMIDVNFSDKTMGQSAYVVEFTDDVEIQGEIFKKCVTTFTSGFNEGTRLVDYLKEVNKKVYIYKDYYYDMKTEQEYVDTTLLLYDFASPKGTLVGEEEIQGHKCKKYEVPYKEISEKYSYTDVSCLLIEGIGYDHQGGGMGDLIYSLVDDEDIVPNMITTFLCLDYVEDSAGNIIYKSDDYKICLEDIEKDLGSVGVDGVKAAEVKGDGRYYNLNGQVVDNPGAGIYIHGGKKVVVK